MIRNLVFVFVALAVLTFEPLGVLAQNKSKTTAGQVMPANAEAYTLLRRYPELSGSIVAVGDAQITLRVKYDHNVFKNGQSSINQINQSIAQAERAQLMAAMRRTSRSRGRSSNSGGSSANVAAVIKKNITMAHDYLDFELPLNSKAVIRTVAANGSSASGSSAGLVEYDEKGYLKVPTPTKSTGQIGTPATRADLTPGAEVRVTFSHEYGPVGSTASPRVNSSGGAVTPPPSNAPRISRVVITK